jgi:dipeptidyl aminopeptidase/acylaminoacyl peptidase
MTTDRHLERDLPSILGDIAMGAYPDYIDDVLVTTAQRRQRPAWTFPERWLPMDVVTRRPLFAPKIPWRTLGALAMILILIAAAVVAYVGSQTKLPAPFGIAANGDVAYASGGDIYTVDPLTGNASAVVTGPDTDRAPAWSRSGTYIAFLREDPRTLNSSQLYVARADGSGIMPVTPTPSALVGDHAFSPDGLEILFTTGSDGRRDLWVAKADGGGARQLDVGLSVASPSFRPPGGAEIVFAGKETEGGSNGLYAVDVATGEVRTILAPVDGIDRDLARVSPDGSRIAFSAWTPGLDRNDYSVHVVAADGSGEMTLPIPERATFQDAPAWSNDGRSLAVVRGYGVHNEDMALAVLPADGSGFGVETRHGLTGCCDTLYEWAPDDTTILVKPFDLSGNPLPPLLWDPLTGLTTPARWAATSDPAWQRLGR